VLYEKNGVITEERFQKMTVAQWIFHYIEIKKGKKEDVEISSDVLKLNLRTITEDIELLGVVFNKNNGLAMINTKAEIREKIKANTDEKKPTPENENEAVLRSEDEELWEFFNSVPDSMEAAKEQADTGRYFLPTVDIKQMKLGFEENNETEEPKEVINQQPDNIPELEIVEDSKSTIKPMLGF
jgi:hypothetical protein